MKRRSNDEDRAQLEQQAMAELARQAGPPPSRPSMPRSRTGAQPAWGVGTTPDASPAPEPAWKRAASRPLPEPEWEADESDEVDEVDEDGWEEDGWQDDEGGDEPLGLLGVPLDYDATGIALQQLAERSNIRRPVGAVSGIDPTDAERIRDRAMAQFLDRQKVRARQDAELAAEREAANPKAKEPAKRAAFPPLSPGLSAKSLVMRPVAPPPLNRLSSADEAPAPAGAAGSKKAVAKKAVAKKAVAKKAVAKKAVAKKAAGTKAGAAKVGVAKVGVAKAGAAKAPARKAAGKVAAAETVPAETGATDQAGTIRPAARGTRKAVTRRAVVDAAVDAAVADTADTSETSERSESTGGGGVATRAGAMVRRSVGTRSRTGRSSAADRSQAAFDEAAREMAAAGAPPPTMDEADEAETSASGPATPKPGRARIGTRARRREG